MGWEESERVGGAEDVRTGISMKNEERLFKEINKKKEW